MGNDVALTISANDQEVLRALNRTADGIGKVVNRIERLEAASGKQSRQQLSDLSMIAGKWLSVGGAISLVKGEIDSLIQTHAQLKKSTEQNSLSWDEMSRKFRVQAGLNAAQGKQADASIGKIAIANSATAPQAFAAAQQLASSGFRTEDAYGPALDVLFKGLSASNLGGGDPTELVQAAGQWLEGTGQAKNAKNLERGLVSVQRLFKGTDVQLSDLTQLASKSAALADVMTPEEILAGFSIVRETTTADKASTGLKIMGERLTGAKGDPTRESALKRAGLTPEQVDMQGESFGQVLDVIAKAVDNMPADEQTPFLQKFFGTEASGPVAVLLRNRGKLRQRIDMQGDTASFLQDAAVNQSGLAAGQRRFETEQLIRQSQGGNAAAFPQLVAAAKAQAIAEGVNPTIAEQRAQYAETYRNRGTPDRLAIEQAFTPQTALSAMFGDRTGEKFLSNVEARIGQYQSADVNTPLEFLTPEAKRAQRVAEEELAKAQANSQTQPAYALDRLRYAEDSATRGFAPGERTPFLEQIEKLRMALEANTKATQGNTNTVKPNAKTVAKPVSSGLSRSP